MNGLAVVHDYLTQTGGAERVALHFAQLFPSAPVYTSLYEAKTTFREFRDHDVRPTGLQGKVPAAHFRMFAMFYGRAFSRLQLQQFDKVLVSTSGFAHHVEHPNAYVYCHTPPHFLYDAENYLPNRALQVALKAPTRVLRRSDQRAAKRHRRYVANSRTTADVIRRVYGKTVDVIHPALHTSHLPEGTQPMPTEPRALIVARLLPYKRVDLAIRACMRAHIPLTVVGTGPEEHRLRALADRSVTFTGKLADEQLAQAFASHSVVLMPGVEDFGFAPLEANYAGRPVVARAAGGATETVRDGENGVLVADADADTWAAVLKDVVSASWRPEHLRTFTEPFSLQTFRSNIRSWLDT
jgi:glycosyltransferase involved in cell wall biosynthesis